MTKQARLLVLTQILLLAGKYPDLSRFSEPVRMVEYDLLNNRRLATLERNPTKARIFMLGSVPPPNLQTLALFFFQTRAFISS